MESSRAGPELLRKYLAGRDVPCEACGYNLRSATDVFCPECGAVIPRPPADDVRRLTADPATLRLGCAACGYAVTGQDPGRCPECGSAELRQFFSAEPPRIRRRWWSRLAPLPLMLLTPLGLCIAIAAAAIGMGRAIGGRARGPVDPWLGMALALGVPGITLAWIWWRAPLARLEPGERKALTAVASLVAIGMLIAAMRSLA